MDIEQLNKSQVILLTLLVSFITSIATGIITVTLMDQAPPSVTQVINRVVERTVETVVPGPEMQTASAGDTVKEVTVVVKENDLITESIAKNADTLVRISIYQGRGSTEPGAYVGIGVMVGEQGTVATDASLIGNERYIVSTAGGANYIARRTDSGKGTPFAYLVLDAQGATFPVIAHASIATAKLGQSVIALSGKERVNVALGNIVELTDSIQTDINADRVAYGSPLFNIFGEVLGLHTKGAGGTGDAAFTPLSPLSVTAVPAAESASPADVSGEAN